MKLVTIPALVLAATASLSAIAAEPPKATGQQAGQAPATQVQPHSHLQEKTGIMPQKKSAGATPDKAKDAASATTEEGAAAAPKPKSAATKSGKAKADKDKTKHFHPRDGK